jgi:hypothetical protein
MRGGQSFLSSFRRYPSTGDNHIVSLVERHRLATLEPAGNVMSLLLIILIIVLLFGGGGYYGYRGGHYGGGGLGVVGIVLVVLVAVALFGRPYLGY